jgi:RNA recognition motif-containing protein
MAVRDVRTPSNGSAARIDRLGRSTGETILKKIYVGNLPFSATESQVTDLFAKHGEVHSVALINDRETGRPRGFGFVEMDDAGAPVAIQALNGHSMDSRELRVNEATERPKRSGGGGGGRW